MSDIATLSRTSYQPLKARNAAVMTVSAGPRRSRLRTAEPLLVETDLTVSEAWAVLRAEISERESIEVDASARSRRRLRGSIDGAVVHLDVHDDNVFTRRKSWNIEFTGEILEARRGSTLKGSIDLRDRTAIDIVVRLLMVVAALATAVAVAIAIRTSITGGAVDLGPPFGTVVVSSIAVLAASRAKIEGELAAASDATLLVARVRQLLGRSRDGQAA